MPGEPGTTCRLYYDCGLGPLPEPGDFFCTPTGTCYQVLTARRSRTRPERCHLKVMRLQRGAVAIGQEGVWPLHWYQRRRSA